MKLTAKDLRIGNKFIGVGMIQTVFEIKDNSDRGRIIQKGYEHLITCKENGNQYKPIEMQPIPLTEEWLRRVDWKGYKALHINSEFSIDESGHLYYRSDYTGINLLYVHSLQNAYHVIKGEELEFKD
jgi:hypothetical protein